MRSALWGELMRAGSRIAMVGMVGGLAGACTTDALRFSENPFSNPFQTAESPADPVRTGSIDEPAGVSPLPRATVQAGSLAPIRSAAVSPAPVASNAAPVTARAGGGGWSSAGGTNVTVGQGDSLSIISDRYGVPGQAILAANNMTAADIRAGRRIVIPVYSATAASADAPRPARVAEPAPSEGRVLSTSRIDVKKPAPRTAEQAFESRLRPRPGQPVVAAAPKAEPKVPFRVAQAEPRKPEPAKAEPASRKPDPRKVEAKPDAKKIDAKTEAKKTDSAKPAAKVAAPATPAAQPAKLAKVESKSEPKALPMRPARAETAAKPAEAEPVKVASREPEATASVAPAEAAGPGFRWPARGRVISGFGGSNEGINIAVPDGTPVKAAGDGVVAYAGSEVKGYGNLVLIRHDNGYVSAYAHNGDLDVKRGQKVARGQTIAKSGQTGNVTSPQLHFEIRKGSTPVDPSKYLASAN